MSGKLTLRCINGRCFYKNTLRGFAAIQIAELRMTMRAVAVHEKSGKAWAQLPSRPWVKDGALIVGDDGKVKYQSLIDFDNAGVREGFSNAVVQAVLTFDPAALDHGGAAA